LFQIKKNNMIHVILLMFNIAIVVKVFLIGNLFRLRNGAQVVPD
jgi:hypothetical protein